jgi:hypothetical protein
VEQVLVKALAIRPAQRFATPTEFAKALAHAAERSEILDDAETREILGRAVELAAQRRSEAEQRSVVAAEQAAAEFGVSPQQRRPEVGEVAVAPSQVHPELHQSTSTRMGNKLYFQRETEGEISDQVHESLVDEIDSKLGIVGRISSFGRSLTWSPAAPSDEERNVVVKITPQDGRTRIYVEERVELAGLQKAAPLFGVAFGAALGLLLGVVVRASVVFMLLSALALAAVGGVIGARAAMWGICKRRRPQLEQLANRLTELAALSKWDSDLPL